MKPKIYIFILITGIFCALYATTDAFAFQKFIVVNKFDSNRYTFYVLNDGSGLGYSTESDNNGWYLRGSNDYSISLYTGVFLSLDDCITYALNGSSVWDGNYDWGREFHIPNWSIIMTYNTDLVFQNSNQSTVEDYLDPPSAPNWWDYMWTGLGIMDDTVKDWFLSLIDAVFGDDVEEGTIGDHVILGNPTLTPAPTPIPYTTVVIPKTDVTTGDTYYETNYYYINPSGTPIITSSPPTNTPSTGGSSNGGDYYPVGGNPYALPAVDWLTSVNIAGNDYDGIDSIYDGIGNIDTIGSEYTDGIGTVQDATGTLPTSWLMLIGIAAAIPLVAGIISRFLS